MTGVQYVRTQWRQVQISPEPQAEDRSTAANPRTAEEGLRGTEVVGGCISPEAAAGVDMNTPLLALPLSASIPGEVKKKRVLLVDTSHAKRDLRAEVLRKLGMYVDSAANIAEARSWWRPALYDLVLINMEKGKGLRDRFCDDLRSATPSQRLAFLVGHPEYLVDSPNADQELLMERGDEQASIASANIAFPADPGDSISRWGILEASRRISTVRSASIARTKAMRSMPPPRRDPEGRPSTPPLTLYDLLREELR